MSDLAIERRKRLNKTIPIDPFLFLTHDYRARVGAWVINQGTLFEVFDERIGVGDGGRLLLCVPNGSEEIYSLRWPGDNYVDGETQFYGNAEYWDEDGYQHIYTIDSWMRADIV